MTDIFKSADYARKANKNPFEDAVAETWPIEWDWGDLNKRKITLPLVICVTTSKGIFKQNALVDYEYDSQSGLSRYYLLDSVQFENPGGGEIKYYDFWYELDEDTFTQKFPIKNPWGGGEPLTSTADFFILVGE